jgi:hypothetical protein
MYTILMNLISLGNDEALASEDIRWWNTWGCKVTHDKIIIKLMC